MESREAIALIFQATLVGSAGIALVLLARQPLRRAFGARAAYAAWWLVPAALVALAIPSAPSGGDVAAIGMRLATPLGAASDFAGRDAAVSWQPWALVAWACGAVMSALAMAWTQARFRAGLGALRPDGKGAWCAEHAVEGLPATIGVLAPRIVLPADFDSRYDAPQRALILAHECVHVARGDARANLAVAVLRCLCWFNPLVHVAARRFRHDQELACDAVVVARHPGSRRAYGDALLQAQCAAQASPLGCHFGFGHPLKERIAMLRDPAVPPARRIAGSAIVSVLVLASGFAAWAAKPASPPQDAYVDKVSTPAPAYSDVVTKPGVTGKVMLIVDVAADGSVAGVHVESAEPAGSVSESAVIATVRKWKFTPATKHGQAVASRVRVPIWFEPRPKQG